MTALVVIRHGPTVWSAEHRLQGRRDLPLSREGRAEVRAWSLPPRLLAYRAICSPLARAVETAHLLGLSGVQLEPNLIEMHWGEWEGRTLAELRAERGAAMARDEALGLDLLPPGGESPRQVSARLERWLADIYPEHQPRLVITHKGVIRALLSLATGWDMTHKPPVRFAWDAAHHFEVGPAGTLTLRAANQSLLTVEPTSGTSR
ncbi:MAG: histidine phosphatase family protein [Pseudomonadota bacterium]